MRGWKYLSFGSSCARPWTEKPIEKIGHEVERDKDRYDDDGTTENGIHISVVSRIGDGETKNVRGEDGFGQNRTFQKSGVGKRNHCYERDSGIAQCVAPDDAGFRNALGASGNDIFLFQLIEHEGTRHAADIGQGEVAEQSRRQDKVGDNILEGRPVALEDRVDQIEAGNRRERIFECDVDTSGTGGPAEPGIEGQEREHAEPE